MINNKKSLVLKVLLGASLMSASYSNSFAANAGDPNPDEKKVNIKLEGEKIDALYKKMQSYNVANLDIIKKYFPVDEKTKSITVSGGLTGEGWRKLNDLLASKSVADIEKLEKKDIEKFEQEIAEILKSSNEAAKKSGKLSTEDWDKYINKDNIANKDEADKVLSALKSLTVEQGDTFKEQKDESTKQVTTDSIEDLRNESQLITATLQERVDNFVGPFGLVSAPASGEEDPLNGVWINGFTGNNTDKRNVKTKSNFSGGSLGYERFVEDNTAVGLAVTAMRGDTKYGSSAKTKTNNLIVSLYEMTNIDNLILSGSVYGGKGDSKTSRQIVQATGSLTANGKFKSNLYGALAGVAYQIEAEQNLITPSVSLQYSSITQKKYTETGAGNFNREIGKKTGEALVGTAAVKYGYVIENNGMTIVPGVQVGVSSDFNAKSSNVKTKYLWENQAYDVKSDTKRQTRFFVTPSLVSKSDSFDLGLSYTFDQAKKAKGNLVTLKLLAKF